ncbi:MAG TPA: N-acetylmuramoyl-L-alanine amidase [Steroidobacteraceae bacterium]|jgi:N-acetylmuramoyl-L-alanine amidase|nr:N-acetylmuramoyl-L-alanine amidase [Steroidobacteraceae bacterium]
MPLESDRVRKNVLAALGVLGALSTLGMLLGAPLDAARAAPLQRSAAQSATHRAQARLEHVSLSGDAQGMTLTLALSQAVHARSLRLSAPERLVIDLPDTRRQAPLPALSSNSLVRAVRSGRPNAHTLRLVLELRARSRVRLNWQGEPHGAQLRIELTRAQTLSARLAPAAALIPTVIPAVATPAATPSNLLQVVPAAHAPQTARDVIIAVDAGHGGVDPGATGPDGTHEKNVTLAIARALAARIDAEPGMRAVLTRDGDYFVPLRDRMERARAAHADLFVSIHADSVRDRAIDGSSVYILSERGASSEAARRLADQENAADLKGGISLAAQAPELRSVLMDLSQNASMAQSGEAAQDVLGALDRVGAVRKREVQQAAFVVLKSPDVPSMLVETAYISNPGEERRLRDPQEQQRLAGAILSGIADYFRQYPPQGSLFARMRPERAESKGSS